MSKSQYIFWIPITFSNLDDITAVKMNIMTLMTMMIDDDYETDDYDDFNDDCDYDLW